MFHICSHKISKHWENLSAAVASVTSAAWCYTCSSARHTECVCTTVSPPRVEVWSCIKVISNRLLLHNKSGTQETGVREHVFWVLIEMMYHACPHFCTSWWPNINSFIYCCCSFAAQCKTLSKCRFIIFRSLSPACCSLSISVWGSLAPSLMIRQLLCSIHRLQLVEAAASWQCS